MYKCKIAFSLYPFCCVTFSLFRYSPFWYRDKRTWKMLLLFVLSREFAFQHAPFMFTIYVQRPHEFSLLDYIIIMMQMEICIEFLSKIFPIVAIEINERVLYAYAIKYREINQEKSKSTRFKKFNGNCYKNMLKAESASQIPLWIEVLKYLHEVFFFFRAFYCRKQRATSTKSRQKYKMCKQKWFCMRVCRTFQYIKSK